MPPTPSPVGEDLAASTVRTVTLRLMPLLGLLYLGYLWTRHRQRVIDTGLVHLEDEPLSGETVRGEAGA